MIFSAQAETNIMFKGCLSPGKPGPTSYAAISGFSRHLLDPQVYYDLMETYVFSAICNGRAGNDWSQENRVLMDVDGCTIFSNFNLGEQDANVGVRFHFCPWVFTMLFTRKIKFTASLLVILLRYYKWYHSRRLNTSLSVSVTGPIPVTLLRKCDRSPVYLWKI